jgi:hypothetical protein
MHERVLLEINRSRVSEIGSAHRRTTKYFSAPPKGTRKILNGLRNSAIKLRDSMGGEPSSDESICRPRTSL